MPFFRSAAVLGWLGLLTLPLAAEQAVAPAPAETAVPAAVMRTTAPPLTAGEAATATQADPTAAAAAAGASTTTVTAPAATPAEAPKADTPTSTPADSATPAAAAATTDPAATAEVSPAPPPEPTLEIGINLASQRMTVTENGQAKYTWPVSSGAYGYPTPTGTFRPIWMSKMWYSRKYEMAPMPHSIFFHGGTAIHATYSVGMLGRPASHGCVRLSPSNAATLFKMVGRHGKEATRIAVYGQPKYSAPRIARSRPAGPRYATARATYGYSSYGYSPYAASAPRYVYPADQRTYYAQARKRRAQVMKQRRVVMRQYHSGYASNY